MNKPEFLKKRKIDQLNRLQKFILGWNQLGKVIISRENPEKIGELRRSLASEFPPSLYLISPEARKGLDIKNFLMRIPEITNLSFSSLTFKALLKEWHDILLGLYWAEGWLKKEEREKEELIEETISLWQDFYKLTHPNPLLTERENGKNKEIDSLKRKLVNNMAAISSSLDYYPDYRSLPINIRDFREHSRVSKERDIQWRKTYLKLVDLLGVVRAEKTVKEKIRPLQEVTDLIHLCEDLGNRLEQEKVDDTEKVHLKGYLWGKYRMLMQKVFKSQSVSRPQELQFEDEMPSFNSVKIIDFLQNTGQSLAEELLRIKRKTAKKRKRIIWAVTKPVLILVFVGISLKIFYGTGHSFRDYIGGRRGVTQVKSFEEILADVGRVDNERFLCSWEEKWHLTGNIPAVSLLVSKEYLWCGDYNGNIRTYDRLLEQWDAPLDIGIGEPVRHLISKGKNIYIGTASGIYKGVINKGYIQGVTKIGQDIKNITCFKLYNDTLWIGTNNGLIKMELKSESIKTIRKGLPSERITCLDTDSKYLWIGTSKGAAYLSLTSMGIKIKKLDVEEQITSVTCREEDVWFGGAESIYQYKKEERIWKKIKLGDSTDFRVKDIALTGNFIWITTQGKGLIKYRITDGLWKSYFTEELSGTNILLREDSLWFYRGGLVKGKLVRCVLPDEAFREYVEEDKKELKHTQE
jgi:hypothetical protein